MAELSGCRDLWRSVKFSVRPGFEDIASSIIFESGFYGLLESDSGKDNLSSAFYRVSPEQRNPLESLQENIRPYTLRLGEPPIEIIETADIPFQDWEYSWRQGLVSVETGKRIVVRPSWVPYDNVDNRIEILIDPKMAFGTGGHATTRLCLEMLENYSLVGLKVVDAGCGSGVLSIAAVKLGAEKADGFDNDPFSVENAIENVQVNGVENKVTIKAGDLATFDTQGFDLLVANLISGVIKAYSDKFVKMLRPGAGAIFSGILAEEENQVCESLVSVGFLINEIRHADEWISIGARVK